ncbi:unnamed protein product [Spirodela intermedia]|uniref:VHS domain-containing protein n=1 Tax=Spirodela intermedia TaxID=51605 RepID=A0A7I8J713_SPIIN|nr:unnamed protein product [Spirodela intermedia]CAA6666017.1 unnamed protein product [Spirodela intermedia]
MDSSRRAVEAYWRSRLIDGVTSDEDKVAPVYKLDEVCELLRTTHAGIVKEVSDYILKRLDHKSPIVKQKALRLIKYAVVKSGAEFRREMQRHSTVVRQLFHFKGYPDPLKGDALNKAVRDTAHEAVSAIFSSDESKAPVETTRKRMEGFGSTNFDIPAEDKKSFLSEVVGLSSASIKQGLSTIAAAHSFRKNDNGSYKSPHLHRSLTNEADTRDRYEGDDHREPSASWTQDSSTSIDAVPSNGSTSSDKSREERLLETIVTSSGVRLQPTRDAIQIFLTEAAKLNPIAMSHALESKLQSHLWQVRMKAICVLESILRSKDDADLSSIRSYFVEHGDCVVKCSESPQASLRDKANKVLSLLDGESGYGVKQQSDGQSSAKASVVSLPDLIDTGESDDFGNDDNAQHPTHQGTTNVMPSGSLVDDLFGAEPISNASTSKNEKEDPFADVSFHVAEDGGHSDDLFSGLAVDEKQPIEGHDRSNSSQQSEFIDIFGTDTVLPSILETRKNDVHDLMAGLSVKESHPGNNLPGIALGGDVQPNLPQANEALSGPFVSQMIGMNQNAMFPFGSMPYGMPQGIMLNQHFPPQPVNYAPMGGFVPQQQLLFQNFGHLNAGISHASVDPSASALPDIFHLSNNPAQAHPTVISTPKEDTRAFDFISDHVSAARNQKRLV